jgi:hypothetical protein
VGCINFPNDCKNYIKNGKEGERLKEGPNVAKKIPVVAKLKCGPSERAEKSPEVGWIVEWRVGI